jgi:hypothetical protein
MTLSPVTNIEEFNTRLQAYVKNIATTMNMSRTLSHYAIQHFEEHGQLGPANLFVKAIPKKFGGQPAFVKWMAYYSPVIMIKGELFKDKSEEAREFNVVEAVKVDFWEAFGKDETITDFNWADIYQACLATVIKFEGSKFHTDDDDTLHLIERLKSQFSPENTPELVKAA